LSGNKS